MARGNKKTQAFIQPLAPIAPIEKSSFYNVPDSPVSHLIYESLVAGANLPDLPARKKQMSNGYSLELQGSGKKRQLTLKSSTSKITIEFADIDKLVGSNKPAKKLFLLALIKLNEQALHNGQLTKDYVSFPLHDLIDIGFYKTIRSAREGFKTAMDALTDIKTGGHIQINKKRSIDVIGAHPFRKGIIDNNQCFIQLETDFDWSFLAQYFTILPRYYFSLPNRASDLLLYIFYLARQHTKEIAERGYFTISFRAIHTCLMLPNEVGCANPQRDIKEAIETAIADIEEEHRLTYNNMELSLEPNFYGEPTNIAEYLNNGYLKVTLSGEHAKRFIEISKKTAKRIEAAEKRQARITEKAIAINTAKKLEADTKTEGEADK